MSETKTLGEVLESLSQSAKARTFTPAYWQEVADGLAARVREMDAARGGTPPAVVESLETLAALLSALRTAGWDGRGRPAEWVAAQDRTIAALETEREALGRSLNKVTRHYDDNARLFAEARAELAKAREDFARAREERRKATEDMAKAVDAQVRAESALATLRQAVEDAMTDLSLGNYGKVHRAVEEMFATLRAPQAPADHPDAATLRAIRERNIGLELALDEIQRSWSKAPTTEEANRLNELGDRIKAHIQEEMVGDSGQARGGEGKTETGAVGDKHSNPAVRTAIGLPPKESIQCEACGTHWAVTEFGKSGACGPEDCAHPQDEAPAPTPEDDWRTVERAVSMTRLPVHSERLAVAALARLKAASVNQKS